MVVGPLQSTARELGESGDIGVNSGGVLEMGEESLEVRRAVKPKMLKETLHKAFPGDVGMFLLTGVHSNRGMRTKM